MAGVLARIWPISALVAKLEWRRRDRQETLVGTATYQTNYTDSGEIAEHHVRFLIDGNDVRYSDMSSAGSSVAVTSGKLHKAATRDRFNWQNHGDLPEYARRADNRPRGKLIVLDGGVA